MKVVSTASTIIDEGVDTRTAAKALKVLRENVDKLRDAVADEKKRSAAEDLFTYEEEADPEVFFVPYLWEIIVCVVTASSLEWNKESIRIFPLLEEEPEEVLDNGPPVPDATQFSEDITDVV